MMTRFLLLLHEVHNHNHLTYGCLSHGIMHFCCILQEVDLMQLPPDTPEVVAITCNSIPGHFVVRTRTVVHEQFKEQKVTSFAKDSGTNTSWKLCIYIASVGVSTLLAKALNCFDSSMRTGITLMPHSLHLEIS